MDAGGAVVFADVRHQEDRQSKAMQELSSSSHYGKRGNCHMQEQSCHTSQDQETS